MISLLAPVSRLRNRLRRMIASSVLCSSCFSDVGLRLEAEKIGRSDQGRCPNCGSVSGKKLSVDDLDELLVEFFSRGSFFRSDFGGAPRLASNHLRYGDREVEFPAWLEGDARLLEEKLRVGIFHNGPPLWQVGEVEPLTSLLSPEARADAIATVLKSFGSHVWAEGTEFYRIRKNLHPDHERDQFQYDSPPSARSQFGRLDSQDLPVMYGSQDLHICIHECRVTIPDECFVATLRTQRPFRLLDLTSTLEDAASPFESLDIAMRYLFSAESQSYEITQAIAVAARELNYDGILYPSYFSLVRPEQVANIGLFGHPLRRGDVEVACINRAMLSTASYEIKMGPLFA
jgi:hypothetical protein